MKPLTGNIYKETFYDQGKQYVNYYVDCAECGREIGVDGLGRGHTVTNHIKRIGWRRSPEHGKWVCPACCLVRDRRKETIMEISCPECGSYSVQPTTQPDEEGYIEYHCADCGHYFVEAAVEALPCEDTAAGLPLDLNRIGCCFPGQCLMPGPHLMSECHTAEMHEAAMRDLEMDAHAVRWARRELKREMRMDWTKWHWTKNATFTICGIPIPIGLEKGTFFPECYDWTDVVNCEKCKRILMKETDHTGGRDHVATT